MMDMKTWAEIEVEIACERERKASGVKNGEWDYGVSCYESALKAFKSLCEDGHSGMSVGITKNILNRLIDGQPLTPIEDTPDAWYSCFSKDGDGSEHFQCKRCTALFKYAQPDGSINYHYNDACEFFDLDSKFGYYNGFLSKIYEEMFPITMPFMPPSEPSKMYCETFLADCKNGDFDTRGVLYVVQPDGNRIDINRYFKDGEDSLVEISAEEYEARKETAENRIKSEADYLKHNGYSFDDDFDACIDEAMDKVTYIAHMIEKAPAVDAAEVRRGKWEISETDEWAICSECGESYDCTDGGAELFADCYHFCPNCGAHMIGGNDE